jgi:hydroxymethylpyrimidine pyrophosphatase-like HAD family hydrolase
MVEPTPTASKISLVLADVDGTLVTAEKVLTPRAAKAVKALHAAGIAFAITSGRPPRGMAMLIDPLALRTPIAGFNGGIFVKPDMTIMEEHVLAADVARRALDIILHHGMDVWVYSGEDWLVRDPKAAHVARRNGPSSSHRPSSRTSKRRSTVRSRSSASATITTWSRAAKRMPRMRSAPELRRPARNLTTSMSPTQTLTKGPPSRHCRSSWRFRPARSPPSVTCRTTC